MSTGTYGSGAYSAIKEKVLAQNKKNRTVFEDQQNNLTKKQRYSLIHRTRKTFIPPPSSRVTMRKEIYKGEQLCNVQAVGLRSTGGTSGDNYIGYSLFSFDSVGHQILFNPVNGTVFETLVTFREDTTFTNSVTFDSPIITGDINTSGTLSAGSISTNTLNATGYITTSGTINADVLNVDTSLSVSGDLVRIGVHDIGTPPNTIEYVLSVSGESLFKDKITVHNGVFSLSDRRLKDHIRDIDDPMSKIENMRGVYYTMSDVSHIGFIAQDIKEVLPEVVQQDARGYYSIEYGNIVALLVEGMKELRRENREKDQKIEALETRLARIEEQVGLSA